jgi:1-acyl-sn-glycerol-3-phosphate acyltransferase
MIGKFILRLFGWKEINPFPDIDKLVVIIAPHTSMMDFVVGRLYYSWARRKSKFIIKRELFFFPLGYILKWFGALPVDRNKGVSVVKQIVDHYKTKDQFIVNITPEGTRKAVKRWKKGFYEIAQMADVPIAIGCLDYDKKEIGIMEIFKPSGDYQRDLEIIKGYYVGKKGRHPENFIL